MLKEQTQENYISVVDFLVGISSLGRNWPNGPELISLNDLWSILERHLNQHPNWYSINTSDILIDTESTLNQQLVDCRPCQMTHASIKNWSTLNPLSTEILILYWSSVNWDVNRLSLEYQSRVSTDPWLWMSLDLDHDLHNGQNFDHDPQNSAAMQDRIGGSTLDWPRWNKTNYQNCLSHHQKLKIITAIETKKLIF